MAIRRTSRALTHFYDNMLEPSGIKVTQLSLLRAVRRLDAPNISTLADELQLDRTTLGRNLAVIERNGLVAVTAGDDLRERSVTLTAAGEHALAVAAPLWDAAQARIAERLGAERLAQFNDLLADLEGLAG
ncbi:MAG TPA: MarR family winged helix-turn-helix transcriptional regulator [Herpetosiphonaceae bacterium]|nr:MarR family winged helix-turn-helix transcriptional regulator [Herpetosiphonaceae bacterium]